MRAVRQARRRAAHNCSTWKGGRRRPGNEGKPIGDDRSWNGDRPAGNGREILERLTLSSSSSSSSSPRALCILEKGLKGSPLAGSSGFLPRDGKSPAASMRVTVARAKQRRADLPSGRTRGDWQSSSSGNSASSHGRFRRGLAGCPLLISIMQGQ